MNHNRSNQCSAEASPELNLDLKTILSAIVISILAFSTALFIVGWLSTWVFEWAVVARHYFFTYWSTIISRAARNYQTFFTQAQDADGRAERFTALHKARVEDGNDLDDADWPVASLVEDLEEPVSTEQAWRRRLEAHRNAVSSVRFDRQEEARAHKLRTLHAKHAKWFEALATKQVLDNRTQFYGNNWPNKPLARWVPLEILARRHAKEVERLQLQVAKEVKQAYAEDVKDRQRDFDARQSVLKAKLVLP